VFLIGARWQTPWFVDTDPESPRLSVVVFPAEKHLGALEGLERFFNELHGYVRPVVSVDARPNFQRIALETPVCQGEGNQVRELRADFFRNLPELVT